MCITKLAPGTIALPISEARKRRNANCKPNMVSAVPSSSSFNVISDSEHEPACKDIISSSLSSKVLVTHEYHDHAYERDPTDCGADTDSDDGRGRSSGNFKQRRGPRGGVAHPFPEKLHLMLASVEQDGLDHIVSWHPHGRSFAVHKPKEFVSQVMPRYFKQTKLTSFQRQLNLYGFCRLTTGRDRGGYFHELFLRDRLFLCDRMMRTRIKGTGTKASMNPESEPDFYQMPFVRPLNQTPRKPPTQLTTWKITFSKKLQQDKKPTTRAKRVAVTRQRPRRRVSVDHDEDMIEPLVVQSASEEPPAVVQTSSFQQEAETEPCCFARPPSYPSILPLCMPVLPAFETTTSTSTSMTVTPPQTPVLDDDEDLSPPPPELPNDDWLLSDSFLPDETLVFEGKTFHYLDASSFDCLQQDNAQETADENDDDCAAAWGFSMKDSDAFFAGM